MKSILSIVMTIGLMASSAFAGNMGEDKKASCTKHDGFRQTSEALSAAEPVVKSEPKKESESVEK